jgi:hypothetical protein
MTSSIIENPFAVMDVPSHYDREVLEFAKGATLDGGAIDENARAWPRGSSRTPLSIEGTWSSRWKGAVDPTIAGDSPDKWKEGAAEIRTVANRLFMKFDRNNGVRLGLIEARREGGDRLVANTST